jgi:uncharacterized membrane protein
MMIRSLLIGLVAGARSMTPLAAVSAAAVSGRLPKDNGAPPLLDHPAVVAGTLALAAGELGGDKMRSAPDRIIAPGIAARVMTGAIAGAALAPRRQRLLAGAVGAGAAVAASYVTFALRMRAMRRYGQTSTGLVEDALAIAAASAIVGAGRARA